MNLPKSQFSSHSPQPWPSPVGITLLSGVSPSNKQSQIADSLPDLPDFIYVMDSLPFQIFPIHDSLPDLPDFQFCLQFPPPFTEQTDVKKFKVLNSQSTLKVWLTDQIL